MCLCAPLSKIYWFINNKLDCYQMPATSTEFVLPIQYSYVWVDTLLKRFQVVNVILDRITLYTSKSWRTLPTEQCNQLSCSYLKTSRGTLCTGPNLGTLVSPHHDKSNCCLKRKQIWHIFPIGLYLSFLWKSHDTTLRRP